MPNTLFPVFPSDSKYINSKIAVKTIGENVYYFNDEMAFYFHHKDNYRQKITDTTLLVNPAWRKLYNQVRSISTKLKRPEAKVGTLTYGSDGGMNEKKLRQYNEKKAKLQEDISIYRNQLSEYKTERNATQKKTTFAELPEDEKFEGVYNESKQLVDTIKKIAFRSDKISWNRYVNCLRCIIRIIYISVYITCLDM